MPWAKNGESLDVTMGALDGAKICEYINLFILSQLN